MCVCLCLFMYWELDKPRPGTVCDFRGCDASVRTHYIKRDVGWRNEVKDFRYAEPDLFWGGGGNDKLCCRTLAQIQSRPARVDISLFMRECVIFAAARVFTAPSVDELLQLTSVEAIVAAC